MSSAELYKEKVGSYILAKDQNKPHLIKRVFSPSATLIMEVKSDNVVFPPKSEGLGSITDVLVRSFCQRFESIYTLCLTDSVYIEEDKLSCVWLVVMTNKETGCIQIGTGNYVWEFENSSVSKLNISIEHMFALDQDSSEKVFCWVESKDYPWCSSKEVISGIPSVVFHFRDALLGLLRKTKL